MIHLFRLDKTPVFSICQAIQNPSDEALQEAAWAAVVHLVGKLKKFYQFSQRLGMSEA